MTPAVAVEGRRRTVCTFGVIGGGTEAVAKVSIALQLKKVGNPSKIFVERKYLLRRRIVVSVVRA
jgi:hypothetical protein